MPIALTDDQKARHTDALQAWFRDERGETLGALQAGFLLDFVLAEIGPSVYAAALADAQTHLRRVVEDLDLSVTPDAPGDGPRRSARR